MTKEINISNANDVIDVRDVIARVEELEEDEEEQESLFKENTDAELETLRALLAELAGNGGDEGWRGDWYPITLVRDSYFKDYAQEFADDIGAINSDATWPNNCINWDQAAEELQQDYSTVKYDGVTYWFR